MKTNPVCLEPIPAGVAYPLTPTLSPKGAREKKQRGAYRDRLLNPKFTWLLALALAPTLGISSGFSQGTINFVNTGATLVTTNDTFHSGIADLTTASGIKIALFYQPDPAGSAAPAPITPIGLGNWIQIPTLVDITPLPGRFNGGQVTTGNDVAPGGNIWLQILGWDGNAPSLSAALAGASRSLGESTVWSQATGDGATLPPIAITPGFTGLVVYTGPEPSTLALGALGAAVLLLFHRSINKKPTLRQQPK